MSIDLKTEIICKKFKHKKTVNNKLIVDKPSTEYYLIPLTHSFSMEYDEEVYKLTFNNQLLWLKYSNHWKKIHIKEDYGFDEYVLIESEDILDIYTIIVTSNYIRRNVWRTNTNIRLNKSYTDKYVLALPIVEDMIEVEEYGEGIVKTYQIYMITNEILLKRTKPQPSSCDFHMTNNFVLNKEALFVRLSDDEADLFL